jgi:O-antigen/teichoic acid export membrane protein
MGVVQRQSLKYSIVNMIGLAIGTVSTLLIYPLVLEQVGLMRVLMEAGIVLLPIITLGGNTLVFRFFPRFQNKETGHHGFLLFLIGLALFGCLCFIGMSFLFREKVMFWYRDSSPLLQKHVFMAIPLACFYALNIVLYNYASNFKRIVVPSILVEFSPKIVIPSLLLSLLCGWISLEWALYGLLLHFCLITIGLICYIKWLGELHLRIDKSFFTPLLRTDLRHYAIFGLCSSLFLLLSAKLDLLFVGSMTTVRNAGIYALALQITSVMEIPAKGIYAASVSTVARLVEDKNLVELSDMYKKVSINLLIAGLLLFGCVWISVDDLYRLLPNGQEIATGKYVLFFLFLSRVVEMTTGLNNYMILYSQFYRWSLLTLLFSAICNIGFNLWLIPIYGMTGAAIAVFLSILCYNALSVGLVAWFFKMQPFSHQTLIAVPMALICFFLANLLPHTNLVLLDIAIHSGAFLILFLTTIFYVGIAPELKDSLLNLRKRAGL